MMTVSQVTIGKTWSRKQPGVVDFKCGRFFNLILSLIVTFYLLFLDN